jgi:hypothetical protein
LDNVVFVCLNDRYNNLESIFDYLEENIRYLIRVTNYWDVEKLFLKLSELLFSEINIKLRYLIES